MKYRYMYKSVLFQLFCSAVRRNKQFGKKKIVPHGFMLAFEIKAVASASLYYLVWTLSQLIGTKFIVKTLS